MSGAQFTKGPWRADFGETFRIRESDGSSVAYTQFVHLNGRRDTEEVTANANLIAAAPDYDAFVVEALPQLEVLHSTLPQGEARAAVWRVILKGRAAVAKARGETA